MSRSFRFPSFAVMTVMAASACSPSSGGEDAAADVEAAGPVAEVARVSVLEPANGSEVEGPDVLVRLSAEGVQIVPAGDMTPGTGHHHLYLDADLGEVGVTVPAVPGSIVHLGTGVGEYTFEGIQPGDHRLIAVVADGAHIPLEPWVVDTVTFTVR
ncbi:MAG: DUF4399 domain-containing protein [Gemmatimonadota bacterium]|nr:DUF4399 domain-containing protein [Gemmatimonadota bacterium]MDH5760931.1 DUF4399 domain-containing protein [Gemmatimonadota bacterium]